ncbi:hypothetical protein CRG98_007250 [Punica granatum]|uniref:Uncharacterized protein n=1 Tax=Punica granatum TaxID=22663 RepID=A0A2I0KVM9_PUNGR|nr:hypothetical protein CRG98_007250 [Punica granatum]
MGSLLSIAELGAALISVAILGLLSVIVFESYRRRHNNAHVDAPAIFEDPNSLKENAAHVGRGLCKKNVFSER